MRVGERDAAVLAVAEHADIVHRAGAVERDQRDDVAERGRADGRQRAAHAFGFQLEHADRVAALEQFVDLGIVPRQRVEVDVDALRGEHFLRALEHRQRLQAEEVELHQPRRLDIFHVELGDRHVRARIAVERHQLVEPAVADDHAGGVGRGVARQAFELHRQVEQPADVGIVAILGGELADAVQRALEVPRLGRVVGDELGEAVDLAVAHLQHAAGVLEHGAGLQAAEGDDLGNPVAAVFALDVGDHLVAVGFAEVDVEVRHRHALGVQEALEQQVRGRSGRGR